MKIAAFESEFGGLMYWPPDMEKYANSVRVTEYVDIEFPPRAKEEIVPAKIEKIDHEIAEITAKFTNELTELKTRKANLLALTDERA